jgi:hypothetical protein
MTDNRADRLRIAATLLAPRDTEGVVRTPLADDRALAIIRVMPGNERAALTSHIDWVQDYEANDTPEGQ